jgi:hypothetical protein
VTRAGLAHFCCSYLFRATWKLLEVNRQRDYDNIFLDDELASGKLGNVIDYDFNM